MFRPLAFSISVTLSVVGLTSPVSAATSTPAPPQCIVSLSPTATDTLYAIGAGNQVQAVDKSSTYPSEAKSLSHQHVIDALNPSVEGLLGICHTSSSHPSTKPDLVIVSYNPNNLQQKLQAVGVKVVEQNAATSVSEALSQILQLGAITGHVKKAGALASTLSSTINMAIGSVPPHKRHPISVFYEISSNPYYSATSATFIGSIFKSMGVTDIADAAATSADAGYPSLSAEYILHANPSLIVLAGDASPASVASRPGFTSLSAVKKGDVLALNADVASQWGPRFGSLVTQLAKEVRHVLAQK
jgi:iron complex transport system substrate-binding protein